MKQKKYGEKVRRESRGRKWRKEIKLENGEKKRRKKLIRKWKKNREKADGESEVKN